MYIRYYRLIRVLPEAISGKPWSKTLTLTYEGELDVAVEALKEHPLGREDSMDGPSHMRKLWDQTIIGSYELQAIDGGGDTLSASDPVVTLRYEDTWNTYIMELKLLNGRRNGSRQNCRLVWISHAYNSKKVPNDSGLMNINREQHYEPYTFARVRALEHLL
jgi:hypothetical protein